MAQQRAAITLLFLLLVSTLSLAQEITIAAAADLNPALQEIAAKFQAQTGKRVVITFGSSGNIFSAINNGAPYDMFFSADIDYPHRLDAAGLTEAGTFYEYALGKLVLFALKTSKLDLNRGLSVLADPAIKKIAIANPRHAPYGRAAVSVLQSAKLYDSVASKFVLGENVSQTAQFVQTGNADIGLIALSLALAPAISKTGRYVLVPAETYPPIEQAAVVLKSAKDKDTAKRFLEFVKSPTGREILSRYGFDLPRTAAK